MPRLTHAIRAFAASGCTAHADTISRTSLAVRAEFANVGNSAHDRASAARCTWWVNCEVFHQTKFINRGSSQFALRVCQTPRESRTSMSVSYTHLRAHETVL